MAGILVPALVMVSIAGNPPSQKKKTTTTAVKTTTTTTKKVVTTKAAPLKGPDRKFMDLTVNPGADFFQYANGGWVKANPIPSTESSWSSFNELRNHNLDILKKILDASAKNTKAPKGSNTQKIGDFYASGMDTLTIEKVGIKPLEKELLAINAIKNTKDLVERIAHLHRIGVGSLFGFYVDQDGKISTQYAANLNQGGLSLPDRDYYFRTDAKSENIRKEFLKHVTNMFQLMNDGNADAKANAIMNLETKLAEGSRNRVALRDPNANYNKMAVDEMIKNYPNMQWAAYLKAVGIPPVKDIIVGQPEFLAKADSLIKAEKIENWKTYLQWQLLHSFAGKLSSKYVNESFHFYGTVMNGVKENEPRWKRMITQTDNSVGELLGQEYVKVAFKPEAKAKCKSMVNNLMAALKDRINNLEWMSAETKTAAQHKLAKITVKIGYPDKWHDYTKLSISRGDYVGNIIASNEFDYAYNMNKIGKPIDRSEWGMTPPTVNAYYNPSMNEIVFPAGILQPPFFTADADDALNYGSIGAVIGHELTHGFDDEGRQFDADGNLKDWWTKQDAENFDARTGKVVKQFDGYVAIDTVHVNGKLTLGENIADLGGLTIAHDAYIKSLGGKPAPMIDGFTGDQRFYLGWAQAWRYQFRPEALMRQVLTNPHSPANFRVLGPLSNIPEFHKAFNIKEGDAMMRPEADRAKIW